MSAAGGPARAVPVARRVGAAMQDAAGVFVRRAMPSLRADLLGAWTTGGTTLPPLRRWLFDGLSRALDREYYHPAADTARREAVKRLCMGEDAGVRWAEQYCQRGFPDRFTPVLAMFGELERLLASGAVARVHQVACCSGREIAHYARTYPHVRFVGSDVDAQVVSFCAERWRALPNLSFVRVRLDALDTAERDALAADAVYASGGLHYMDPPSLRRFFQAARTLTPHLLLSQPLDRDFVVDAQATSRPRRQLSWNHPYVPYLHEAGWRHVAWSEGVVDDLPHVKNVGVWAS